MDRIVKIFALENITAYFWVVTKKGVTHQLIEEHLIHKYVIRIAFFGGYYISPALQDKRPKIFW